MRAAALLTAFLVIAGASAAEAEPPPIAWEPWSDDLFDRAVRDHKFVLLDLEAVWCHWCHVMDERTYQNPKVREIVAQSFIAVKVDQDSRPDLAERYKDYGWPATIMFAPDGTERVKLAGYYGADLFSGVLKGALETPPKKPVPIPNPAPPASRIPEAQRATFEHDFDVSYDLVHAGWGRGFRFVDAHSIDYSLDRAFAGDKEAGARARATLDQALLLIDPVWGGAYQYSDEFDWRSPHFEKITPVQATELRLYSEAWARWHEPKYRAAADSIFRYLRDFLRAPDGGFYASQDADLRPDFDGHRYYALDEAGRRAAGQPQIDKHLYAREAGLAATALIAYYGATGTNEALDMAKAAANWALAERRLPDGGFRHDARDKFGPFLDDSLAMSQALLALYFASGERGWLAEGRNTADFLLAHFTDQRSGALRSVESPSANIPVDANIEAARTLNLLSAATGVAGYRAAAEKIFGYLISPQVPAKLDLLPGALLLDRELSREPLHVTVVGPRKDESAAQLLAAALAYPAAYKRVDRWDRAEGPLPNSDVEYPPEPGVAAYACSGNICSLPVIKPDKLAAALDRVAAAPKN